MSNFSCEHVADISPLYIDGDLEPATVARLERHLALCPGCTEALARLRAALVALHALPDVDPGDLAEAVMARLAGSPPARRPATPVRHVLGVDGPLVRKAPGAQVVPAAASPAPTAPTTPSATEATVATAPGRVAPQPPSSRRIALAGHGRRIAYAAAGLAAAAMIGVAGYALAPRPPEPAAVLRSAGLEQSAGGWLPSAERQHRERGEVWIDGAWRSRDEALRALMALRGVVPREGVWLDAGGWERITQGKVLAGGVWVDAREHAASVLRRDGLQEVGGSWLAEGERQGLLADGRRVDPEAWLADRLGAAGYVQAGDGRWRPAEELARPAAPPETAESAARSWLLANGYALVDGRWRDAANQPQVAAATADPLPTPESLRLSAEQQRWSGLELLPGVGESVQDAAAIQASAARFRDIDAGPGSRATTVQALPESAGMPGWRVAVRPGDTLGTPAVVAGRVHVASGPANTWAYAFHAATGVQLWSRSFSDPGVSSPQPVGEDVVYTTESCSMYRLTGRTGRLVFGRYLGSALYAMPQEAGDALLTSVPAGGGFALACLDARSGATGWVAPLPADLRTVSVAVGDRVVAGLRSGTLAAWSLRTGASLWQRPIGILAPPSSYQGGILVRRAVQLNGTSDRYGEVLALADADGGLARPMIGEPRALLATSSSDPSPLALPNGTWPDLGPVVPSGRLAISVRGDAIEAIDLADGRMVWSETLGRDAAHADPALWTHADPCVGGGLVVAGSLDGRLTGLDLATGRRLWQANVGASIGNAIHTSATMYRAQPVLADGRAYVTTLAGDLVCVDTGERRYQGPCWWGHRPE
jgi:outer membrane protein assembly factor BamB